MKVYFSSCKASILYVGGAYFGRVDGFERFAEIDPQDELFAEFIPENGLPVGFFLTEKILKEPPKGVDVYILPNAISLYVREFPSCDFTLRVLNQARFGTSLITLFSQGKTQLSLETERGFYVLPVSEKFARAKITYHGGLYFLETPNALCAFTADGKKVFDEEVRSYSFGNGVLEAELALPTFYEGKGEWSLTEEGCFRTSFSVKCVQEGKISAYPFFLSVLLGVDVKNLLSEDLAQKSEVLKEFLGEFFSVLPTNDENTALLVSEKSENVYLAKAYRVEIADGKIADVTRNEKFRF